MSLKKPIFLLTWILAGCAGVAHSETPKETAAGEQLTLEALEAEVVRNNPEAEFYRAEVAAAKGELRTARTLSNPELSGDIGRKRTRSDITREGEAWSVSLQQTFEWPGRISLRKAIANEQVKLAELGLAQFEKALSARARNLAYTLFAAQEKADAVQEVANRLRSLREVLVQRDPAGLTPLLETRIIEATELTVQRRATEAELASRAALLELNQLRGKPWGEGLQISEPALAFGEVPGIEALLLAAHTSNFQLLMRRMELEQQGFRLSLAKNERYPAVTAGPFYSQERAGEKESIVGLSLSVPIPVWDRKTGQIESEKARAKQAETLLRVAIRETERSIIEKVSEYEAKVREMQRWRPDSISQFKEAAATADRHYRLGAVPIATYVELQKEYLEAVEALLDTKREALEARGEIELLTGTTFNAVTPNEIKK